MSGNSGRANSSGEIRVLLIDPNESAKRYPRPAQAVPHSGARLSFTFGACLFLVIGLMICVGACPMQRVREFFP
jgi:hypothetical protein